MEDFNSSRVNLVQHSGGTNEKSIWLWHCRLGHPSFGYIKHLLTKLFLGLDPSVFNCDTCILAKSHRVPFSINSNKSSTPFALIHTDV